MIGLDTNVIVRYIVQDDEVQSAQATRLVESLTVIQPGFVTLIAIVELVWVLQGNYAASRHEVTAALETLLKTKEIIVEQTAIVWQALRVYTSTKADFADSLIERLAHAAQCEYTLTFDRSAAKHAGMRLIDAH